VSKFKKKQSNNALIRRPDGTTGFTTLKSAHRNVRCGVFDILPDGSFQRVKHSAAPDSAAAASNVSYRFYQEQIKEGAWKRLVGPRKITAKEGKAIPLAGDIRRLGLSA
jgi:hypothetical protein